MKIYAISIVTAALMSACGSVQPDGASSISPAGEWRFSTDSARWDATTIVLPGSMASNGLGNDISVNTPWMGEIVDNSYFTDDKYARYRKEGNVKVPFWLQPCKYYNGVA